MPLAPPPTLRDTIAQALGVSRLAETPAERVSLLRAASALAAERRVERVGPLTPSALDRLAREVDAALTRELRVDAGYASFRARVLAQAMRAAAKADVRAVERAVARARARDAALGGLRPDVMREVAASLDRYLETARQLRLARDQWNARKPVIADYRIASSPRCARCSVRRGALDDVRTFSGPSVRVFVEDRGGPA